MYALKLLINNIKNKNAKIIINKQIDKMTS